ncbi:hypothetical protein TNCV_2290461 [Trichonephila clavipes]|uniref:Uncharacterized protein n=1 Tax=Trichonephila clavipes TaxID=2585209 RepID=A0A8X6RNQ2_TRICX|nr:hypothetical protein TNCV_2290461 [Trichonephila clavipes]
MNVHGTFCEPTRPTFIWKVWIILPICRILASTNPHKFLKLPFHANLGAVIITWSWLKTTRSVTNRPRVPFEDKGIEVKNRDKGSEVKNRDKGSEVKNRDKGSEVKNRDKGSEVKNRDKGSEVKNRDKGSEVKNRDKGSEVKNRDKGTCLACSRNAVRSVGSSVKQKIDCS